MKARTVQAFLELDETVVSAPKLANGFVTEALRRLGHQVDCYSTHVPTPGLALELARLHTDVRNTSRADLAVFDDSGLELLHAGVGNSSAQVVLLHGLTWHPGLWMTQESIRLRCVNSSYANAIVTSLLSYPNLATRSLLNPRAFSSTATLRLPLPCVEYPNGHPRASGGGLPSAVDEALKSGDLILHSLQPNKTDWLMTIAVLLQLNHIVRGQEPNRRCRLIVHSVDYQRVKESASGFRYRGPELEQALQLVRLTLEQMRLDLDDLIVPSPWLSQGALFEVMRRSHAALAFNVIPESFGFYVLESVFNGCPVFTNGIGNMRHALPADHGLYVIDDERALSAPFELARDAAAMVHREVVSSNAGAEACAAGRDWLRHQHSLLGLTQDLAAALERVAESPSVASEIDGLRIGLNPAVRSYGARSRIVVSDYQNRVVSEAANELLQAMLGRTCGDVLSDPKVPVHAAQELFAMGILGLRQDVT